MKRALILGAGLVVEPMLDYLFEQGKHRVTLAARNDAKAKTLVADRDHGVAVHLDADDNEQLAAFVAEADVVVSLLPYTYHVQVAKACLDHGKSLVTTSYVSKAMQELDQAAREKGVLLLNEIGLDPGIDHMSAMRVIDQVKAKGGKIREFRSFCGGLPAPEANDNPFGYKFSWSPKGVLLAGTNAACYRRDGKTVEVPGKELFAHHWPIEVDGLSLEAYPNRNSLDYIEPYGLADADTVLRGTLRYPGWSRTMYTLLGRLGFLDGPSAPQDQNMTCAQITAHILQMDSTRLKTEIAHRLDLREDDEVFDKLAWLGLFADAPFSETGTAPIDFLTALMLEKMRYAPAEKDMIVLYHEFLAEYPEHRQRITSTLLQFGTDDGTAMARTVSLPAAIAVELILDGEIVDSGVHIPTTARIYEPVLHRLEQLGIACRESFDEKE